MPATMKATTAAVTSLTILATRNKFLTSGRGIRSGCDTRHNPRSSGAECATIDGMPEEDGGALLTRIERRLKRAGVIANVAGAIDLFVFALLLLPTPEHVDE